MKDSSKYHKSDISDIFVQNWYPNDEYFIFINLAAAS